MQRAYKYFSGLLGTLACLCVLTVTIEAISPAFGQGFMVQPMRMEAAPRAGSTIRIPLRINNTSSAESQLIELRLVDLTQTPQGNWRMADPERGDETGHDASARDWIELEADRVELPAASGAVTDVAIRVPRSARGAHFAALLAELPQPPDTTGLVVRVRFLIPIIIHIQGRPAPQQVEISDATMIFNVPEDAGVSPTTLAHLHVQNSGQTFSRVRGQLSVARKSGDRWRQVTRLDIPERGIMPGLTLELGQDLGRRLPSGTYRLRGEISVDGRRVRPLEKEVEFEGDPNIDVLAYDTALNLTPDLVRMDVAPGATRTTALSIENPSDDPIRVRMEVGIPTALRGVAMGELRGDALSAVPWTELRPSEFTIRPRGRQNVRVISRVPADGVNHANYYADLVLQGSYPDGQSAGDTRSVVHLVNRGHEAEPRGIVERLLVSAGESPSEYIVQTRFVNIGNVHIDPTVDVQMLTGRGTTARALFTHEAEPLLPLGTQTFSGSLDLSEVDAGYYVLRATVRYGSERAQSQHLIEVTEESDEQGQSTRAVIILDDDVEIELPEGETLPGLGQDDGEPSSSLGG